MTGINNFNTQTDGHAIHRITTYDSAATYAWSEPPAIYAIEIRGEKLTCDEALKRMTYYLGNDERKYELYKSSRKNAKEYIRSLFS